MNKLFISCPMRGRTEENIHNSMERMHKMAEAFFGQELEVIPSYIPDRAPDTVNRRICVENDVSQRYGIPNFFVDLEMMPDACEVEKAYWDELHPVCN